MGDFIPWHHPSLIGVLASSSAPFRSVPSIIYRWEYISSEEERAVLLLGKRSKKVSGKVAQLYVERTFGKKEVKFQM